MEKIILIIKEVQLVTECKAEGWYGLVPFLSIRYAHHVVTSNHFVPTFSEKLPWPASRLYVNRFHQL